MRTVPILLAVALGLGLAAPAAAQGGMSVRIDSGSDEPSDALAPEHDRAGPGTRWRGHRRDAGHRDRPSGSGMTLRKRALDDDDARDRRDRRGRRDRHRRNPFLFPHFHDDDDADRIVVIPVPTPRPAPPEAEPEPAAPAPPPDPRGPAIQRARGTAPGVPYSVGEALPGDVPHVTLDWRRYALPEPPPGKIYVRVGRDVLLIDAATRTVERRVEPAALTPGEG